MGEENIKGITDESFSAMTSNGDVKLDYHIYKLSFLNFLLGKQPNGPGQFIFGKVAPESGQYFFAVDYSALAEEKEEVDKEEEKEVKKDKGKEINKEEDKEINKECHISELSENLSISV